MKTDNQPTPKNYAEAVEALGNKTARKVANNTYLEWVTPFSGPSAGIAIRLHATHVVTFFADGTTELNSGGYQTQTTKERINRYLVEGSSIQNVQGNWHYVSGLASVLFHDGLTVVSDSGKVCIPFKFNGEQ